ncbi:stage II sporulation protein P [Gemmiger formicilis]|uniref:stage II sporulation protein P n=1 Tax=Gemmiger formicilis TaxID=745368 RepID=UPI00195E70CB|nr:stage II sporulation protein P [Gemmiger formicilis]MBM6900020.1 stage II sporulation protein P [Gemmiger formicilis]
MGLLRRCLHILLCTALFAGSTALSVLAVANLPGHEWLLRGALLWQDPVAAAAVTWPVPQQKPAPQATSAPEPVTATEEASAAVQEPQGTATPAPAAIPEPTATPLPSAAPDIENSGSIRAEQFGQGSGEGYITLNAGSIRNYTSCSDADLRSAVSTPSLPFDVEVDSDEPQVLILHTHATETYQTWPNLIYDPDFTARTQNTALNMCAVGEKMTQVLNDAGINTLHDTTLHDSPSYTESYDRSYATTQAYLEKYPSIKVVLDVHRDAIEDSDGTRVKPLCTINGEDTAQVMIIAGCDNGSSIRLPNWRLNLRFAAAWEEAMESRTPGLTRPVMCAYRYYNQDLTTGSLLIEIGGHANTVTEAIRAGQYAAEALAVLLGGHLD